MGMDAGEINVGVGAKFDPTGFNNYTKALKIAQSAPDVTKALQGKFDDKAFKAFDTTVKGAASSPDVSLGLGGDFDESAFTAFIGATQEVGSQADVSLGLAGDFDASAFRQLESAHSEAQGLPDAVVSLEGDYDSSGFDKYSGAINDARSTGSVEADLGAEFEGEGFSKYGEALQDAVTQTGAIEAAIATKWKAIGAGVGAGAALAIGMGVTKGLEQLSVGSTLAVQLDLGKEESAEAGRLAGDLYAENYGDSVGEVANAIKDVSQNIARFGKISEAEMKRHAGTVLNLSQVFGAESIEITRTAGALVENGLARSVDDAMDLITSGFQRGADKGGEFLDTLNEYAEPMASLGIGAKTFTDILVDGSAAGIYSIDKIGDAFKEFSIRAVDGSTASVDAYKVIGLSADDYAAKILKGGDSAKKATSEIIRAINGVSDPIKKEQAGVALFGSMWEDIGGKAISSLDPMGRKIKDVSGAADEMGDILADSASAKIEGFKRRAGQALTNFAADAIDSLNSVEDAGGKISNVWDGFKNTEVGKRAIRLFEDMREEGDRLWKSLKRTFGDVLPDLKVIGKAIAVVAGEFGKLFDAAVRKYLPAIRASLEGFARFIRGIIKIISGILTGDFGKVWDGVKDVFSGGIKAIFNALKASTAPFRAAFAALWNPLKSVARGAWNVVEGIAKGGLDKLLGAYSSILGVIEGMVSKASKIPFVGGKFKGLAEDIKGVQTGIDKYRESLRKTDDKQEDTKKSTERLRNEVKTYKERLKGLDKGTSEYRNTADKLKTKQTQLNKTLAQAENDGKRGERGVRRIGDGASGASRTVGTAAKSISTNIIEVAKGLDIKPPKFNIRIPTGQGVSGGGSSSKADRDFVKGHATGGIPNPGSGARDDHMLVDPSGQPVAMMSGTEGILNTPQMGIVHNALQFASAFGASPYGGLDELWGSGMRHYAGGGLMGANPGLAGYANMAAKAGLHVSDGLRPGGITSSGNRSQHADGNALDLAGSASAMLSFARSFGAKYGTSVDQLIHTPLGYGYSGGSKVSLSFFGPKVNADHYDHVHLGDATPGKGGSLGGGAVGAGGLPRIVAPSISGTPGGALLDIAKASARLMAKQGNQWVEKNAPAAVAPANAGGPGGGLSSAGGTWDKGRLKSLWSSVNPRNGDANLMAAIALAESSGNPNSIGIPTSGGRARGLWQIMWPLHASRFPGKNPFNPRDNASMAGSILKSQGINAWEAYTRGMHTKYLVKGGKFATGGRLGGIGKFATGGRLPSITAPAGVASSSKSYKVRAQLAAPFEGMGEMSRIASSLSGTESLPHWAKGKKGKAKQPKRSAAVSSAYQSASIGRGLNAKRFRKFDALKQSNDGINRTYSTKDREFGLSEEILIDDEGNIDQKAIDKRVRELSALYDLRKKFLDNLREMRKLAKRIIKTYKTIIERLKNSLKHSKKKERPGVRQSISDYTESLGDWSDTDSDLGFDIADSVVDLKEIRGERASVKGTKAEPPDEPDVSTPDGSDGDTDTPPEATTPDAPAAPEQVGPTPEQIAQAAAEQLNSFNASRAELFSQFGSNFVSAGARAAVDETVKAAGATYFGSTTSGDEGASAGRAGVTFEQTNIFHQPPPDNTAWAMDSKFQIENLIG